MFPWCIWDINLMDFWRWGMGVSEQPYHLINKGWETLYGFFHCWRWGIILKRTASLFWRKLIDTLDFFSSPITFFLQKALRQNFRNCPSRAGILNSVAAGLCFVPVVLSDWSVGCHKCLGLDLLPTLFLFVLVRTLTYSWTCWFQCIPYSVLLKDLDMKNLRELEDLIIEAVYTDIIQGKLDQRNQMLEVDFCIGRDIQKKDISNIVKTLQEWWGSLSNSLVSCA